MESVIGAARMDIVAGKQIGNGMILNRGYPIIFALNVFHNPHLIQKCILNQQQLLIWYTLLNQMRVVKTFDSKMIQGVSY